MAELAVEHLVIDTNPSYSRFELSPIGIAYLAAFGNYLVVNNTSHNTEISQLKKSFLEPIYIYDESVYPDDLDKAAFDLDIHAVLRREDKKSWLMLNHFGRLKVFDINMSIVQKTPIVISPNMEAIWLTDVEQTLLIDDCLISTSPGGYYVDEPAKPGFFVSAPLSALARKEKVSTNSIERLEHSIYLANFGMSTALAINSIGDRLAIAFGQDVFVCRVERDKNGFLSFDEVVSHVKAFCCVRYLAFWAEEYLFCAGHDVWCEENTENISNLKGGGYIVLDIKSDKALFSIDFNRDLAWGNGGQCLAIKKNTFSKNNKQTIKDLMVIGIDRQANLLAWNSAAENAKVLFNNENECADLGIAHLVSTDQGVVCGFNRGGARLHRYSFLGA